MSRCLCQKVVFYKPPTWMTLAKQFWGPGRCPNCGGQSKAGYGHGGGGGVSSRCKPRLDRIAAVLQALTHYELRLNKKDRETRARLRALTKRGLLDSPEYAPPTIDTVIRIEQKQAIHELVDDLPEKVRLVVRMQLKGYSFADIAQLIGKSSRQVRKTASLGADLLRQRLLARPAFS